MSVENGELFNCPKCGHDDEFVIQGTAHDRTSYYIAIDKETMCFDTTSICNDEVGDTDWNESYIRCANCETVIDLAVIRDGIDYGGRTRAEMIEALQSKEGLCPYCGNPDIYYSNLEVDDALVTQGAHCGNCEKSWSVIYRLSSFSLEDVNGKSFSIDINE